MRFSRCSVAKSCHTTTLSHFLLYLSGVVYHSVFTVFFTGKATFTSSKIIVLTSCAEFQSSLIRKLFFAECLSRLSHPEHLNWKKRSPLDWDPAWISTEVSFRASQLRTPASYICVLHHGQKCIVLPNKDIIKREIISISLNIYVNKWREDRKHLFVLLQIPNGKLFKGGLAVLIKLICVEKERRIVTFVERFSCLNHEKHVLHRINVEVWVMKVRDANSFCRRGVLAQILKMKEWALVLHDYLANSNVLYICRSRIVSN